MQELSLVPPLFNFDLLVALLSLRLGFQYDTSYFSARFDHKLPLLNLGPYFEMPKLRELHLEHIFFGPEMQCNLFPSQQRSSPIEDLRLIDCSPQTVGILAKMPLPVESLNRLSLK